MQSFLAKHKITKTKSAALVFMKKHVLTPVVLTARVDANAEQGHERLVVHLACMLGKGRQHCRCVRLPSGPEVPWALSLFPLHLSGDLQTNIPVAFGNGLSTTKMSSF